MLALKLLGMLLILLAGALAAVTLAKFEKQKLSVPEAWVDLILYIQSQIDCYLTPLDEILSETDPTVLKECMCRSEHPTLEDLLDASSPYLNRDCSRLLSSFVREIGGGYREEQLRRCEYYIHALRKNCEKISADLPSRVKLNVTLCICTAIGIAILLW